MLYYRKGTTRAHCQVFYALAITYEMIYRVNPRCECHHNQHTTRIGRHSSQTQTCSIIKGFFVLDFRRVHKILYL